MVGVAIDSCAVDDNKFRDPSPHLTSENAAELHSSSADCPGVPTDTNLLAQCADIKGVPAQSFCKNCLSIGSDAYTCEQGSILPAQKPVELRYYCNQKSGNGCQSCDLNKPGTTDGCPGDSTLYGSLATCWAFSPCAGTCTSGVPGGKNTSGSACGCLGGNIGQCEQMMRGCGDYEHEQSMIGCVDKTNCHQGNDVWLGGRGVKACTPDGLNKCTLDTRMPEQECSCRCSARQSSMQPGDPCVSEMMCANDGMCVDKKKHEECRWPENENTPGYDWDSLVKRCKCVAKTQSDE